jgi:heat shock protein HslJ
MMTDDPHGGAGASSDHDDRRDPSASRGLTGRDWLLEAIVEPALAVPAGIRATARFEEGRVAGSTGCNRYHGAAVSGAAGKLRLGPLATTMRACPDDRMVIEGAFLVALDRVRAFRLAGQTLELRDGEGGALLRFVAEAPLELEDVDWSADGVNNGRGGVASLVAGSRITARLAAGRISGSDGCNRYMGPYQVDVDGIRIGPLAGTRMACLDPAVSEQAASYLAALERVSRFAIVDRRLELRDHDGALQVSFRVAEGDAVSSEVG